jgi:hypothetical protein
MSCHPERSEGSTSRGVLRLHAGEPFQDAVRGCYQRSATPGIRAQVEIGPRFTATYRIDQLVWFEETPSVVDAIAREKQVKGWLRRKKIALIESANPEWEDLSEGWYDRQDPSLAQDDNLFVILSEAKNLPDAAPGPEGLQHSSLALDRICASAGHPGRSFQGFP